MEEIQTNVDVEASLQRELDTLWANTNEAKNFTIFRTPHNISQSKKNLFQPSVISIGPLHRGQKHLKALDEQKRRFLQDFMSRGSHISLDLCISEMKFLEKRTRRCYSETFDDLDYNSFVKMMLLDGCFVLEYFLRIIKNIADGSPDNLKQKRILENNSSSIVEVGWNSYFIQRDLLLLENQIPFFIVEKLYEIGLIQECKMNFVKYIAYIFLARIRTEDYLDSIDSIDKIPNPPAEIHHLAHLCYHYLVPHPEKPDVLSSKSFDLTRMFSYNRIIRVFLHRLRSRPVCRGSLSKSIGNISSVVIPSATELKQKGLKFKRKSKPRHMLDISFEYGVLKIPRLKITDSAKPIFANLIAFEHSKYGKEHSPFTSFVVFLDKLVNTPNDVIILQECGIIENWLGSEEELAHFLNQVTESTTMGECQYLAELYREVNRYSRKSWNRQRAKLIRDYFSSPWAIISLIAAFILLVLTFVQSFFAVYAYKHPPSS